MKVLAQEDVELVGIVHVKYNLTRQGRLKPPKTQSGIRKVELMPATLAVLKRQRAKKFMLPSIIETIHYKLNRTKHVTRRRIFVSRIINHSNALSYLRKRLLGWLRKEKLIHREPYQLIHTFASQMLMISAAPIQLASQLGHGDQGMIRKVYGNGYQAKDLTIELIQLESWGNLTPSCPQKKQALCKRLFFLLDFQA